MTFEETKLDYANKAQTKIIELTDIIYGQLSVGGESPEELEQVIELLNFHESLLCDTNPWSEADTLYWIEYFIVKYNMVDIPWVDTDIFVLPIGIPSGINDGANYATVVALNAEEAARQNADTALGNRITVLEADNSDIVPQSLIDDVAANKALGVEHETEINTLITELNTEEAALAAHKADTAVHIQVGERTLWTGKVSQATLTATLLNYAAAVHTHVQGDITGLTTVLNDLQAQINALPVPADGDDGATPNITIGTVTEGETFAVTLDGASTVLNPILNFVLVKGDTGAAFTIDAVDNLANKSLYDASPVGFAFLAQDTGDLYILLAASTWSSPIPFKGTDGWTPRLGLYEHTSDRVILEIPGFFGGTGDEPELDGGSEVNPRFFLTNGGYTTFPDNAINIKGRQGSDGNPGRSFIIDQQGTTRSIYDAELEGFTFYNTSNGKVSWKLSDTASDWSAEFQWKGVDAAATAQTANTVYAGPVSGSVAIPTFRALVEADVPFAWKTSSTTVVTTPTIQGNPFFEGNVLIGAAGAIITPSTRLDIRGLGIDSTTSGLVVKDSTGTETFRVSDNGAVFVGFAISTPIGGGPLTLSGNVTSSAIAVIEFSNNSVFSAGSGIQKGLSFTINASGQSSTAGWTGLELRNNNDSASTGVKRFINFINTASVSVFSVQKSGLITGTFTQDDALTRVVVSNASGELYWRDASTFGGGGITNTAVVNELMKSDGTNAVPSGLASTVVGNLNLGLSATTGLTRSIVVAGSELDIGLNLQTKGIGDIAFLVNGTEAYHFDGALGNHSFSNRQGFTTGERVVHIRAHKSVPLNGAIYPLRISANCVDAGFGVGIGVGMEFETKTSVAGNYEVGSVIESVSTNIASGNEAFKLAFKTMSGGLSATRMEVDAFRTTIFTTAGGLLIKESDTGTNNVITGFRIERSTSGLVAVGFGIQHAVALQNDAGTTVNHSGWDYTWSSPVAGAATSKIELKSYNVGALENVLTVDRAAIQVFKPFRLQSYAVASVPTAADHTAALIYVNDESGGATIAFSNGVNWLRVQDRAIIS